MIMNIVLVVIFFFSEQLAQGDLTMAAQEEAHYQKAKNREQPQQALLSCLLLNQLETLQHLNFLYQGYQPMDCHGMCHHHRTKILP